MTRGTAVIVSVVGSAVAALGTMLWLSRAAGGSGGGSSRERVVEIARSQLGKADLSRYFASVAPEYVGSRPEWCGIFALWVLHEAGLAAGVKWIVAKGFLFRLPQTTEPKPGDIAYFTSNQHQAVVAAVRPGEVDLINGNGSGGVVTESTAPIERAAAYYSIQPWIDAAESGGA